jgi:hypothetical protein
MMRTKPFGGPSIARTRHQMTCPQCGTEFVTIDRRQRFCSIACARVGKRIMTGADSPNWKGGRIMHDGYVRVRVRNHPRSSLSSSYLFEHILVMEQVLGRHLLPHERVHHKNGRRNDNRPENLELWHVKDPPGVRAADYHCFGCLCSRAPSGTVYAADGAQLEDASRVAAGDTRKSGTRNTQSPQFAAPPVVVRGECAGATADSSPRRIRSAVVPGAARGTTKARTTSAVSGAAGREDVCATRPDTYGYSRQHTRVPVQHLMSSSTFS